VSLITQLYTEERYGNGPATPDEVIQHASRADKAWQRVRESILRRWVRRFWPFLPEEK